jgi:hypothetical protein
MKEPSEETFCYEAAQRWRGETRMGKDYKLELKCWNKEEADKVLEIMKSKYPEVPVYRVTWMEIRK